MPRAYPQSNYADQDRESGAGEWQALRGELVALLDKVENHYGQAEIAPEEPAMTGLARRVRQLRDQVSGPETTSRRQEALLTVKRAVDRFHDRDVPARDDGVDDLSAAIAEIRQRQGVQQVAPQVARRQDMPEIRELGALVGGMSQRLETLESELRSQRSSAGNVHDVASQVEQLTQVVELLAGAIGETGQVKRLEAQIAALGAMIETAPQADLSTLNARLDDVSGTVSKLAELQAEQMEREVVREKKRSAAKPDPMAKLAPAMQAIEESVRNVYDRIDAIERNVGSSSGEFEKLTGEMAAFTQAMKDNSGAPDALIGRVEALAERLETMDSGDSEVAGLKADIGALRDAVLQGMEPRFSRIESQIEKLSGLIDSSAVEGQLKTLMARMDDAAAQLDGLAKLHATGEDRLDFESLANMVAERTSDAVTRKAPAPVAMFGPESLKSIEDRIGGLIKSAGKTPDYNALADMIADRTSEAVAKSAVPAGEGGEAGVAAMEKRMTALLNTAGKETTERLARLETMLSGRGDAAANAELPVPVPMQQAPEAVTARRAEPATDPFAEALGPRQDSSAKLDSILANLSKTDRDTMPANPADEAPLVDPGFKRETPVKPAAKAALASQSVSEAAVPPRFDMSQAQKPPRPQSSLVAQDIDPFAEPVVAPAAPEPVAAVSSTSTFVAAARRAQRVRQEQAESTSNSDSIIGRALARVRSRKEDSGTEAAPAVPVAPKAEVAAPEKPAAPERKKRREAAPAVASAAAEIKEAASEPSFLTRHRRPLLLAATLVAVSMLALNLVMQRMNSAPAPAPVETNISAEPETTNPPPSDDQSAIVPPRVIDLIDTTATGSINPGEPLSFSRPTAAALSTPVPPAIPAATGGVAPAAAKAAVSSEITGSIAANPAPAERFELPSEAVGPLELREAAANGMAEAQFEVAAIYSEGRLLDKDPAEAAKWYERAAAQGFAPAQYRLGNLYEVGSGVEKDLEQARLWYQRGAEAGNRMAMHNLAALFAGGQLGDQEFELAAKWFEAAAGYGMTDSQFNLGMLYARGLGVEQSFEQSYKWFSLAARSGDKDAAQARDDIAKSLSADAMSRINGELADWTTKDIDLAANFAPIGTWATDLDPGQPVTGRDVILKVQQALGKLGFDVGTPDGVAGPKTAEAIKLFERATGMNEIGTINPRLLAVLGSQPV